MVDLEPPSSVQWGMLSAVSSRDDLSNSSYMTGGLLKKRAEQCFLEGSETTCHPEEAGPTSSSEEAGEGTALCGLFTFC